MGVPNPVSLYKAPQSRRSPWDAATTTNAYADIGLAIDVQSFGHRTIEFLNGTVVAGANTEAGGTITPGANNCDVQILETYNCGLTWHVANEKTNMAPGDTYEFVSKETSPTHIKVQCKATAPGSQTTVTAWISTH